MNALYKYLTFVLVFSLVFYIILTRVSVSAAKALAAVYMFTPAVSALLAYGSFKKFRNCLDLFSLKLALLGAILPLIHLLLVKMLFNAYWVDPAAVLVVLYNKKVSLLSLVLNGIILGATVNAAFALGEEVGWRGLMFEELKGSRLKKSLVIGSVWCLWHWPFIITGYLNFPQSKALGLLPFWLFTVSVTYVMLVLRERDGVWSTAVLHGTLNGLGGLEFLAFSSLPDYLRPPAGLLGGSVWTLIAAAAFIAETLARRFSKASLAP